MAIETPQRKRQKKLLIILGAIVLVAAVILYWGFFSEPKVTVSPEEAGPAVKIPGIKLDLSVLENSWLKEAKSYGDLPVKAEVTGRTNPFIPY